MKKRFCTTSSEDLEDVYRITTSIDGNIVMVENLSVPDSCVIQMHQLEEDEVAIKASYVDEDWSKFIVTLIELEYLQ